MRSDSFSPTLPKLNIIVTVWLKHHGSELKWTSEAMSRNIFSWKIQYTPSSCDTHVTYDNKINPKDESQPRPGPSPQAGPLDTKAGAPHRSVVAPELHGNSFGCRTSSWTRFMAPAVSHRPSPAAARGLGSFLFAAL